MATKGSKRKRSLSDEEDKHSGYYCNQDNSQTFEACSFPVDEFKDLDVYVAEDLGVHEASVTDPEVLTFKQAHELPSTSP